MGTNRDAAFPFPAVAGMGSARQALMLLATDPGLRGLLIASGPGTAKSLLARALPSLLVGAPFVEVPLGVTEDRLLGGLHLEQTVLTGRRHMADGLLARAHGGFLCVDEVNLLDRRLTQSVADALKSGVVLLERDGLSSRFQAEFALIGTYDANENAVCASLSDAVGLHVTEAGGLSSQERLEVLKRTAAFDRDPFAFARRYAAATATLRERIAEARSRLPEVVMTEEAYRHLSLAALRLGVEGHRADIFAVRAARAHAAIMSRGRVQEEDLKAAVQLVLWPRAAALPDMHGGVEEGQSTREGGESPPSHVEDLIAETRDGSVREELLDVPRGDASEKRSQRGGGRVRKSSQTTSWSRGRYVRSVAHTPEAGKIAIGATLRAAAPFQTRRRKADQRSIQVAVSDLRFKQFKQKAGILIIFAVDASGSMAVNRISQAKGALMRLLEKAYLHRDLVALVGFRGDRADVLLPPSRSVELAKRAIDAMPVGGGTPLAAALESALALARRARHTGIRRTLLVLLTDGHANVARGREPIWHELEGLCGALQCEGVAAVVVDTRNQVTSGGEARMLADLLGGRHVRLSHPGSDALYDTVAAAAETM